MKVKSLSIGFFPGRFQPFHKNHLNRIIQILQTNELVIIGVRLTNKSPHNPFTPYQRKKIIEVSLTEVGIQTRNYQIKFIPDLNPLWPKQIIDAIQFDTFYSGNIQIINLMKNHHSHIVHLNSELNEFNCSGDKIRKLLKQGQPIKPFVASRAEPLIKMYYQQYLCRN